MAVKPIAFFLVLCSATLSACISPRSLSAEEAASISEEELEIVRAAERRRIEVIESVYGAVVAIYGNDRQGGGSGVLYDPQGYALTNHHVVAAAGKEGWAGLADGKLYRWKLIGTDPGGDVAIIRLEGRAEFPAAPIGDSDTVRVGDWVMAMGNPFVLAEDQRPTVTLGIVSGVKRYQEGSGLNQLVYGNCIQVDSSINPGNSGGPLFNMRGQVIGINGRGSFEERGRVNVGLGYAISSNQIKAFIPELLATKIAQHGTLDAVFGNRQAGVICHMLNRDAPIARLGLDLGDRLIAFEGQPITDANQFTNVITTIPAGWPASVTFDHQGESKTVYVRLTALPYEPVARPVKQREEKPAEPDSDHEPTPGSPTPESPKPETPDDVPRPRIIPPPEPIPLAEAGAVRDKAMNEAIARDLVKRWRQAHRKKDFSASALKITSEIRRNEEVVGTQSMILSRDGRLRVEYQVDGKTAMVACDGERYWDDLPNREPRAITRGRALLDPHFSQAMVLGCLLAEQPLADWDTLQLDGSDKGGNRLCYRLSLTDETSEQLFIWLSVYDRKGQPGVELVKTAAGIDDDEPVLSTVYEDFRTVGHLVLPHRRALVRGLAEFAELEVITTESELLSEAPAALFKLPE